MFIFSNGPPKTFNLIRDRKNLYKHVNKVSTYREKDGILRIDKKVDSFDYGARYNIWKYSQGYIHSTKDKVAFEHPAIMPEKLAKDHIISWSNPNDLILDPMMGSGTTLKAAKELNRKAIGIEISEKYCEIAAKRLQQEVFNFGQ